VGIGEVLERRAAGLERLATENPNDARYAVAFARHLTYVEDTRRDGIDRLEQLANSGDGKAARVAWRQALLWLLIGPADFPRYARYLALFPDDAEVKSKVDEVKAGVIAKQAADLGRERLKAGYNALDLEAVDQAEGIFKTQLLENPRDVDALTGLGNAQLRKERFDEAITTFEKVKELAPRRRELWENAIQTATFWKSIRQAEALRKDGKPAAAEPIAKDALARGGPESHHAKLLLAHLYVDLDRLDEARTLFEALVAADPKHVAALKGLVDLYLRSGDETRALETNARLAAIDQDAAMSEGRIRAELLRREALALRERGQLPEAEGLLDAAFANDPTHLEVLLAQAYVYLDLGKLADARRVVDMARRTAKDEPRVTIAEVWVCAGEQRFADGLALLSTLKDHELDAGTRGLERRLRVEGDVRDAVKQASRGKLISAQARLTELQRSTRDAAELMGLVANGWADIGKFDQALAAIYEAITQSKKDTPTLKLQLAGILHKANREHELVAVLRELETDSELTIPERRGLANLKIAYA
ncbi:MAG TPA: tetratricopeptide repeat protein, partial [Myxococcota bacterium]|nr:tetratricopeptide repeat protein [Myxococcota bacterium]